MMLFFDVLVFHMVQVMSCVYFFHIFFEHFFLPCSEAKTSPEQPPTEYKTKRQPEMITRNQSKTHRTFRKNEKTPRPEKKKKEKNNNQKKGRIFLK